MTDLGTSEKPLRHIGEQLSLQTTTVDPADPSGGEAWIRSDVDNDEGELIGVWRYYDGSTTIDVPIYPVDHDFSDFDGSLAVRIKVDGQTGIIPTKTRDEAVYPNWSVQHNSEKLAFSKLTDVPTSVVSRNQDDDKTSTFIERGLVIDIDEPWKSIGVEISSNVDGSQGGGNPTQLKIYRENDDTYIREENNLTLNAGDTFVFEDVDLDPEFTYHILAHSGGDDYTVGLTTDTSYPYISDDDNLQITTASNSTTRDDSYAWMFSKIGYVGFD